MPFFDLDKFEIKLTPTEETSLHKIKDFLITELSHNIQNNPNIERALSKLIEMPFRQLIWLAQQSEILSRFFRTDPTLQLKLEEKLKTSNYSHREIYSMDGKEYYPVFDLYLAAALLSELEKPATPALNKKANIDFACQLGSKEALIIRCQIYLNSLNNKKSISAVEEKQTVDDLQNDTGRLSNLYWAEGFIRAGHIFNALTSHFLMDPLKTNRGNDFLKEACDSFLKAYFLQMNISGFDLPNVKSADDFFIYIKEKLEFVGIPMNDAYLDTVKKEIESKVKLYNDGLNDESIIIQLTTELQNAQHAKLATQSIFKLKEASDKIPLNMLNLRKEK